VLKVLIADDEPGVGKLIHALIEWDKLDMESAGICQDGQTAWEAICREKPDIVITDIRMPNLSGLDLVRMASENKMDTQFIIVSGYRYFEYAHNALKYGVEEYLLKPIEEDELNQILDRIRKKKIQNPTMARIQQDMRHSRAILTQEFIKEIAASGEDGELQHQLCRKYNISLVGSFCSAYEIRVDRNRNTPRSYQQEAAIGEMLIKIVEQESSKLGITTVAAITEGLVIPVLFCWDYSAMQAVKMLSHNIIQRLREYFSVYMGFVPTLGMSRTDGLIPYYSTALWQAHIAVDERILCGCNQRIKWDNLSSSDANAEQILSHYRNDYMRAVEALRESDAGSIVRDCFNEAEKTGLRGNGYYEMASSLLHMLTESVAEQEVRQESNEWYENLYNITNVDSLILYMEERITSYMEEYRAHRLSVESRPVREAMQYIKANYNKKISLEEIADQFHFTAPYFSEMFKKQTGKTFTDYLTEVRMDRAKELLRDSNTSVRILAEQVGYKDVKYFSQQFTKQVGIKPSEYRRLYQ
jgi:two-component system response regulator YesN